MRSPAGRCFFAHSRTASRRRRFSLYARKSASTDMSGARSDVCINRLATLSDAEGVARLHGDELNLWGEPRERPVELLFNLAGGWDIFLPILPVTVVITTDEGDGLGAYAGNNLGRFYRRDRARLKDLSNSVFLSTKEDPP